MSTKNWIRVSVVAGLLAWPGVETYRYCVAIGQREAALQRQERVAVLFAQAKAAHPARQARGDAVTAPYDPATSQARSDSDL